MLFISVFTINWLNSFSWRKHGLNAFIQIFQVLRLYNIASCKSYCTKVLIQTQLGAAVGSNRPSSLQCSFDLCLVLLSRRWMLEGSRNHSIQVRFSVIIPKITVYNRTYRVIFPKREIEIDLSVFFYVRN